MTFKKNCDKLIVTYQVFFLCLGKGAVREAEEPGAERPGFNLKGGADNMRVKITLACSECKQRNYDTVKNKKNTPDRIELNKYCPFCRKHTLHKETK